MAYDIYMKNINDIYIGSKFIRTVYSRPLRNTSMSLLIEPFFHTDYLREQSIVRLICVINDYKSVVLASTSRNTFRKTITEALSDSNT